MRVSKKLSVFVGTVGLGLVQQDAVHIEEMVKVIQLGANDLIYYLSGVYIAVQGIVDAIKGNKNGS